MISHKQYLHLFSHPPLNDGHKKRLTEYYPQPSSSSLAAPVLKKLSDSSGSEYYQEDCKQESCC